MVYSISVIKRCIMPVSSCRRKRFFGHTMTETSFVLTDDFSTTVLSNDIYTELAVCIQFLARFYYD